MCDDDGNIIVLDINLDVGNERLIVGSLYGTNQNEEGFFNTLDQFLTHLNGPPIILGGDLNATWDNRNVNVNLDVHAMQNIPSIFRTNKIRSLCTNFNLVDPFRSLYPNKKDFTYVPSVVDNLNRSRIDFFMITVTLLPHVKNCSISAGLLTTHFDHKCIYLNFKKKPVSKTFPIKISILKEDEVSWQVTSSIIESYIQHATINENYTLGQKEAHLLVLGQINILTQESLDLKLELVRVGVDNLLDLRIAAIPPQIEDLFSSLPELNFFEELDRPEYCNDALFFDTLVHCVRNGALLQQKKIFNIRSSKKNELISRIKFLKGNYNMNSREIHVAERLLNTLIENDLRQELMQNKKFEVLNDEKMTAHFSSMAKVSKQDCAISEICNDLEIEFPTTELRSSYIKNYFGEVYKKPEGEQLLPDSISNFLGDTANNNVVQNSKLTEDERSELDLPITLLELEQSINSANMKSAPGPDGITNPFIKHFWGLFRVPLLKYANACFASGNLTDNFRRARIRLIPKKGNKKLLKNWRPISLLNCFYKIISRVISTRLKKYMDKLTPTAQKGYSTTRQCQEVLISVIDAIAFCKNEKKRGAVLSLDIRKAFDTVSHQFMSQVFDFFNFGPNIKKWLILLGTNRQACIILEDELCTDYFDLERGNAQGDNISPFTFNLCYQILLFKLQFDLQIASIVQEPVIPPTHPPLPNSVSTDSPRVYGLADDATVLTTMDVNSLSRIKAILEDFGSISGLECNVEKTILMQVGSNLPVEPEIVQLGFDIRDEITLLGLIIQKDSGVWEKNFSKISNAIKKEINFWIRFNLSLPGRIAISKSMLYSQLNYLGCFLPLTDIYITEWSNLIENYVLGPLNIAKNRRYLSRTEGGLGLFDIKLYLSGQKCNWVKRAKNLDDNWKQRLYSKSLGNIFNLRSEFFDKKTEPILFSIADSFEKLLFAHTNQNENCRVSYLFKNTSVFFMNPRFRTFDEEFFGEGLMNLHPYRIRNLKVNDVINADETRKTFDEFRERTGILCTVNKFRVLSDACMSLIERNRKNKSYEKTVCDIQTFMCRVKQGSKHIRSALGPDPTGTVPHNLLKFAESTDIVIGSEAALHINGLWGKSYLDNSTRTFLFSLHNNTIGTNARLSHFVRNHSRICTFCALTRNPHDEDENPLHLFFQCRHTEPVVLGLLSWFVDNDAFFRNITRQNFFGVFNMESNHGNIIMQLVCALIKKYIWDCKLRFSLPNLGCGKEFLKIELDRIICQSTKIQKAYNASEFNIYRE
jgi:hypothetical protein